jgi:hypothetical protein
MGQRMVAYISVRISSRTWCKRVVRGLGPS